MDQRLNFKNHNYKKIVVLFYLGITLSWCANKGIIFHKTCTTEGTFKMIFGKSFPNCIDECQRRQRCEMVMYKHGIDECNLKDYIDVTSLTEENPVCMFTNTSKWNRTDGSVCTKTSCGVTETCIDSKTDERKFECVISECPKPMEKNNAQLFSNVHDIGSTNRYKCDPTFGRIGVNSITCNADGSWTYPVFGCGANASSPNLNSGIADLVTVTGDKWMTGTRITYACRPNYQGTGVNFTSVVKKDGSWKPQRLNCCNNNITEFSLGPSFNQAFSVTVANTPDDMQEYCKNIGGDMRTLTNNLAVTVFNLHEDYRWLVSRQTKEVLKHWLRHCLLENNIIMTSINTLTYKELADKVAIENLKNPGSCSNGNIWAPGEPNGGDGEDCIVFAKNYSGAMDADCATLIPDNMATTGFVCYHTLPRV